MTISGRLGGFRWTAATLALVAVACGADPPRHLSVEIRGLDFQPAELPVAPGDTLTWVNADLVPHTITAGDERWDSGDVAPGGRYTLVVTEADVGPYRCRFHPSMTGVLRRRERVATAERYPLWPPRALARRDERSTHPRQRQRGQS